MSLIKNIVGQIPLSTAIFLFFLAVYWFTMSGIIQYGDEAEKYLVTQSIIERGDFSIRPTAMRNEVGTSGRTYSIYELGASLFQIPFYLLGKMLLFFFPTPDPNRLTMLAVGLLNPFLTALTCVVFFKINRHLGFQSRTSLALTIVYGLATIAWPYSKGFNREPILTLLILLLLYTAILFRQQNDRRWLIAHGFAAGGLVFTKLLQSAILPIFFIYILVATLEHHRSKSRGQTILAVAKTSVIFVAPIFFFLLVQSIYSFARFGTLYSGLGGTLTQPLELVPGLLSAGHPVEMSLRLLFSQERSILLYSPPIILFPIGLFKWIRQTKKEALLVLGLILISFLLPAARPDGDTPGWWGTRYLVQITPLFLFPIGVLLEDVSASLRRFWWVMLGVWGLIGMGIQLVGVFSNNRDHLDIVGSYPSLMSQLQFITHHSLDSMLIYVSPADLQINPFGIMLIALGVLLGFLLGIHLWSDELSQFTLPRYSTIALILLITIQAGTFALWVVAPYPRVLSQQADNKYLAGNLFLADGKQCQANGMYMIALQQGTNYQSQAIAHISEALELENGIALSTDDLTSDVEAEDGTLVEQDSQISLSDAGSVRVSAPSARSATVFAISRPVPVLPETPYLLSGWLRVLNVYGSGYASVSIYEDDGLWRNRRTSDISGGSQTSGWMFFSRTITTMPTTRRVIIKTGLWKTYGTVWIDNVRLLKLDSSRSAINEILPPCRTQK